VSARGRSEALIPAARSAKGILVRARGTLGLLMAATALSLAACGEKPQTAGAANAKKADAKAWEGSTAAGYSVDGWKAGDKDSWEAQMKARAQRGQNEYSRSAAAPTDAKAQ
jgi:preprotein translocase subunit SecG